MYVCNFTDCTSSELSCASWEQFCFTLFVCILQMAALFFFFVPSKRDREALAISPNHTEDISTHGAEENSTHSVTGSGTDSKQTVEGRHFELLWTPLA